MLKTLFWRGGRPPPTLCVVTCCLSHHFISAPSWPWNFSVGNECSFFSRMPFQSTGRQRSHQHLQRRPEDIRFRHVQEVGWDQPLHWDFHRYTLGPLSPTSHVCANPLKECLRCVLRSWKPTKHAFFKKKWKNKKLGKWGHHFRAVIQVSTLYHWEQLTVAIQRHWVWQRSVVTSGRFVPVWCPQPQLSLTSWIRRSGSQLEQTGTYPQWRRPFQETGLLLFIAQVCYICVAARI